MPNLLSEEIENLLERVSNPSPEVIIFIGKHQLGGANLVAKNLAKAFVQENKSQVAIVATGLSSHFEGDYLGPLINQTDLAMNPTGLSLSQKVHLAYLASTLNTVKVIISINSAVGYEMLAQFGNLLSRADIKTYAAFFCPDFDRRGRDISFGNLFYKRLDGLVDGFISDHGAYLKNLAESADGNTTKSQLITLKQPTNLQHASGNQEFESRLGPQVIWASRLVEQKGFMTVKKIARQLPHVSFAMYGEGARLSQKRLKRFLPKNVTYFGAFTDFHTLLEGRRPIFLYTSKWDGIPNVLLEAAAANLPIVTSGVGGIRELLENADCWGNVVTAPNSVEEFVEALNAFIVDPERAKHQAATLRKYVAEHHSWGSFRVAVRKAIFY